MSLLLCGAAAASILAASPPAALSFSEAAARARPAAEQLEAEALRADAERALALTGGHLADGLSLGAAAGPRRGDGEESTDVALDLDADLLAGSAARRDLSATLAEAAPVVRTAAAAAALQGLSAAWVEAWLAAARIDVGRADLATLERWGEIARRRVEGGAEPPFEATLIAADLAQARTALAVAMADRRRAWAELAALADLPPEPVPLALPEEARMPRQEDALRERFERGAARQAVGRRAALREMLLRVEGSRERSRLSLRSSLEREGEEEVARVGVAYRLPRPGEAAALAASLEAAATALRREAEVEAAALAARFTAALETVTALEAEAPAAGLDEALSAVELRLVEGEDPPSQALAVRRQLLAARQGALERLALLATARAELAALTTEVQP